MIRVINLLLTVMILLAVASCTEVVRSNGTPDPVVADDHAKIYAAAIRKIHSYTYSRGMVYVVSTTEDPVYADSPKVPSRKLPSELQGAVTTELDGAPFVLIWIDELARAPINPTNGEIAGGDGILITLGDIHPQDDGSVRLSFFMTCAKMCSFGKTYVLKKSFSAWAVTSSVDPEIAS